MICGECGFMLISPDTSGRGYPNVFACRITRRDVLRETECECDAERRAALLEQYGDPDLQQKYDAAMELLVEWENEDRAIYGLDRVANDFAEAKIARRVEEKKAGEAR